LRRKHRSKDEGAATTWIGVDCGEIRWISVREEEEKRNTVLQRATTRWDLRERTTSSSRALAVEVDIAALAHHGDIILQLIPPIEHG
jgi:hypothetical protein